jgi:hypothetical protein
VSHVGGPTLPKLRNKLCTVRFNVSKITDLEKESFERDCSKLVIELFKGVPPLPNSLTNSFTQDLVRFDRLTALSLSKG